MTSSPRSWTATTFLISWIRSLGAQSREAAAEKSLEKWRVGSQRPQLVAFLRGRPAYCEIVEFERKTWDVRQDMVGVLIYGQLLSGVCWGIGSVRRLKAEQFFAKKLWDCSEGVGVLDTVFFMKRNCQPTRHSVLQSQKCPTKSPPEREWHKNLPLLYPLPFRWLAAKDIDRKLAELEKEEAQKVGC